MTIQINIELPNDVFSALRSNPETFVQEMRLAAAVKWYEVGILSQSKAAEKAYWLGCKIITLFTGFKELS